MMFLDGLWIGVVSGLSAKRVSLGSGKDSGLCRIQSHETRSSPSLVDLIRHDP
jgi:hypothetical protein